jgi:hypothetical protein
MKKSASERLKERREFERKSSSLNLKSNKAKSGWKKYFIYDNEVISGWTYMLRTFLQTLLIPFFGLGLYLQSVTAFKRAQSLHHNGLSLFVWAVWGFVSTPIGIFEDRFSFFIIIPHWYLWLRDRNKRKKDLEDEAIEGEKRRANYGKEYKDLD